MTKRNIHCSNNQYQSPAYPTRVPASFWLWQFYNPQPDAITITLSGGAAN